MNQPSENFVVTRALIERLVAIGLGITSVLLFTMVFLAVHMAARYDMAVDRLLEQSHQARDARPPSPSIPSDAYASTRP
jgi:hypothetical protein